MRPGPVALLIPVLARPQNVGPLRESIRASTPPGWRLLFIASPGDLAELEAIDIARHDYPGDQIEVLEYEGNYAAKINAGIDATDEPLIFVGADDLRFHPGWLEEAWEAMLTGGGVVGTQDLCNPRVIAGEHATHFLVARSYVEEYGTIDEPGKLLHEGYPHEYVDNELIETAQARGKYTFADGSVVEHLHPLAGKAPTDELYAAAPERMRRGKRIFEDRRHLWRDGAR